MGPYFGFLFARPSFVEGMARVLDMGGTLQEYNNSPDPDGIARLLDMKAIEADWNRYAEQVKKEMAEATKELAAAR